MSGRERYGKNNDKQGLHSQDFEFQRENFGYLCWNSAHMSFEIDQKASSDESLVNPSKSELVMLSRANFIKIKPIAPFFTFVPLFCSLKSSSQRTMSIPIWKRTTKWSWRSHRNNRGHMKMIYSQESVVETGTAPSLLLESVSISLSLIKRRVQMHHLTIRIWRIVRHEHALSCAEYNRKGPQQWAYPSFQRQWSQSWQEAAEARSFEATRTSGLCWDD